MRDSFELSSSDRITKDRPRSEDGTFLLHLISFILYPASFILHHPPFDKRRYFRYTAGTVSMVVMVRFMRAFFNEKLKYQNAKSWSPPIEDTIILHFDVYILI